MKPKYGPALIGLHWFMLLLIIAVYANMELRENFPKGSDIREGMKIAHSMLGMLVLALVILRLGVRMFGTPAPRIEPEPSHWIQLLSKAMHVALYAFMIVMPVLGWLMLSAAGKPIPFALPPLLGVDKELAHLIKEIHEVIGNLGYALIGLHTVAALFHHYVLRDNTLRRILPMTAA